MAALPQRASDRTAVVVALPDPSDAPDLWPRCIGLVAAAFIALAVGLLFYVSQRAPGSAQWLPAWALLDGHRTGWLAAVGGWLPSFVHPFAFALLSASLRAPRTAAAAPAFGACAAWWLVGVLFEGLQHPSVASVLLRESATWTAESPLASALVRPLLRFAAGGTFDVGDLVATTAGALAAAAVLWAADRAQRRHRSIFEETS